MPPTANSGQINRKPREIDSEPRKVVKGGLPGSSMIFPKFLLKPINHWHPSVQDLHSQSPRKTSCHWERAGSAASSDTVDPKWLGRSARSRVELGVRNSESFSCHYFVKSLESGGCHAAKLKLAV